MTLSTLIQNLRARKGDPEAWLAAGKLEQLCDTLEQIIQELRPTEQIHKRIMHIIHEVREVRTE